MSDYADVEMRRKHFVKNAPAVFGRYWKTNASRYFEKSLNTILNWRKGKTPVPRVITTIIDTALAGGTFYNPETNKLETKKRARIIKH